MSQIRFLRPGGRDNSAREKTGPQGERMVVSSGPPTLPPRVLTLVPGSPAQGPGTSLHSPLVCPWLCLAAGRRVLFPWNKNTALNHPAPLRGSSRRPAHQWQGMPGIVVSPALEPHPPLPGAGPRRESGGAQGTRSPMTRMTTGLHGALPRGRPGYVVSAHSPGGRPFVSSAEGLVSPP